MAETIHCDRHGESKPAFVCCHLIGDGFGLGFNRNPPLDDNPFPDAWCDNCEIIRAQNDGWTEESEKLADIQLVCAGCYNQSRIRNTIPDTTLADLAGLKWKCHTCEEWHTGPCLDFGADKPDYWSADHEKVQRRNRLLPSFLANADTWRDDDHAMCDDEHFFIRGLIRLPIIGTNQHFCWGVWGSLSRDNFMRLIDADENPERAKLEPMFSWLNTWLPEYGERTDIKMRAHIQEPGMRPHFEIEHTDHPLAQEYHHGIHPRRVKEIMLNRLRSK